MVYRNNEGILISHFTLARNFLTTDMLFNSTFYKLKLIGRILCESGWELGRWIKYEKYTLYLQEKEQMLSLFTLSSHSVNNMKC